MGLPHSGMTRRSLVLSALAAAGLRAEGRKGEIFASEAFRYPDPLTEIEVYRLTFPDYSSTLTAYYNRGISNNSNWMLCASNRGGSLQGFRLDLKSGEMKQMTQAEGRSPTWRAARQPVVHYCGTVVHAISRSNLKERQLYEVPEGRSRRRISVGPDGTHVTLVERRGDTSPFAW
jgi:hypothetical protein